MVDIWFGIPDLQEHDIIESKPDNKVEDLRLHKPWPELQRSVLPSAFYFECGIDVGLDGSYLIFIPSFCISWDHVLGRCESILQQLFEVSRCLCTYNSTFSSILLKNMKFLSGIYHLITLCFCSYVDEFDIDTEDNNIHKHIPFAVLLIKIAEDWKNAHDGKLPANARVFKVILKPQTHAASDISFVVLRNSHRSTLPDC